MIRISQFEIKNYKSCVNTKVELSENLTTLIGVNGVGKSNILNSLKLLRRVRRTRYFNSKEFGSTLSKTSLKFDLLINRIGYQLKADIFYEADERNIDEIYSNRILIKKNGSKDWVEFDLHDPYYRHHFHGGKIVPKIVLDRKNEKEENKIVFELIKYLTNINYYSATQFSDPTQCPVSIELEDSRLVYKADRIGKSHDKFIYDLFSSWKNDNKAFKLYLSVINRAGIGLIDDLSFVELDLPANSYEVKSGGKIKRFEKNKNIIVPQITLDGLSLSMSQLSEGTFKTLALIFYILNDKSNLLLIEEPEVCVHHGLLNSIVELIKTESKNKQIIISTHSDYILDKLLPENILLVGRDKKSGTKAKSLTKTLSKNEYRVLKDYLCESGNLGEYWKEGGFENE